MKGVVAAPELETAEVGRQILLNDGNAIDAAVAMGFAQGVVAPTMTSIGGWGILQVYNGKTGESLCIDFHGRAPLRASADMYSDKVIGRLRQDLWHLEGNINAIGHLAVATPGNLLGYWELHQRFGRMSWKEVMQPAIDLASKGFAVGAELATTWSAVSVASQEALPAMWDYISFTEDGLRIFGNNGKGWTPGDIFVNQDYANTLTEIAENGPDVFYNGWIAERIAKDFAKGGGLIDTTDLKDYRVSITDPLSGGYRGHVVNVNQPPASGVQVLETLNILEGFDLRSMGFGSVDFIYTMAMAQKAGFVDRGSFLGDPLFTDVPVEKLLSAEQAEMWIKKIRNKESIELPNLPYEPKHTTTVSTMDEEGNAVGMTHTLANPASGVVVDGLGFMFNNAMTMFYPYPGHPNSIAPGKRRMASMCPLIILKDGKAWAVISSPGGTRILTANLQGAVNLIDFDMTPLEAVYAPRVHNEGDQVDLESRSYYSVNDGLEALGMKVVRSPRSMDPSFANLNIVAKNRDSGSLSGASDPRGRGTSVVV